MDRPAASAEEPDLSGQAFGDYLVLRRLGQGGMAVVYLARQESLQRNVALKVLKSRLAQDAQYVRRFRNEAQAAAALVHANIVQVHEVGHRQGLQFIAQEYVAGQNLKQLLDRQGGLGVEQAIAVLRQVAAALAKAGQHGIVHRDIKPENILICTTGEVKVADFGLARQQSEAGGLELTQVGITMGTPLYMSPEQVEGKTLDGRSDLYSLGVTAYQMLAGHPPFTGETPLSVALQHVKAAPAPLAEIRSGLPQELCDIVHRMLSKEPADRYRDAGQLLEELEGLSVVGGRPSQAFRSLSGVATLDGEASPPTLVETRELAATLAASRHNPWPARGLLALSLVAAAAAGVGLGWAARPHDPLAQATFGAADVIQKESAEAQFWYAMTVNTEAAWKSVALFFPLEQAQSNEKERLAVLRSQQQLARWYLTNDRPADAIAVLDELEQLDETHNDLRATALAWKAIAYDRMGQFDRAADVLASALTLTEFMDRAVLDEVERLQGELRERFR